MKISILLSAFFALSVHAQTATVLGIPEGVYTGKGQLTSQSFLVPDLSYETRRTLSQGTIAARTKAFLFGHEVGGASARLRVKSTSSAAFVLEDLDSPDGKDGYKKAGQGACNSQGCSFSATVMNGKLQLKETWIRSGPNEFIIQNGWQNMSGAVGVYNGRLAKAQ